MDPDTFLPLSEVSFYILLSLASSSKHGYGIWKDVETLSNQSLKLSTSTLYDALERMLQQGLILRVEEEGEQNSGRVRKFYRINELGRKVLAIDMSRMQRLLDLSTARLQEIKR